MIRSGLVSLWAAMVFMGVLTSSAAAQGNPAPQFANVPYGDGHPRQVLDIYLPARPGPHPVVVFVHGGGWRNGDKISGAERAGRLLERGIALVSINYRYSTDVIFPAQIHDCKGAVRWLRANAQTYNLNPERIGIWGGSAGGHLSALVGASGGVAYNEGTVGGNAGQSSRVQAAVAYAGHMDFWSVHAEQAICGSAESRLLGHCLNLIMANRQNPDAFWAPYVERANMAGPLTHVTPDDAPMFLLHGLVDDVVIPLHSMLMHDALAAAGVPVQMVLVPDAGHAFSHAYDQFTVDHFVRYLSPTACSADWNRDAAVNSADIASFITTWLNCLVIGAGGADVNEDGVVNSADISAFITGWLSQLNGGC